MKRVLLAGADVTIANSIGYTALHMAAQLGGQAVMQSMLEHGAPVDQQCRDGSTALHIAIKIARSKSTMLLLLKAGAFTFVWHG